MQTERGMVTRLYLIETNIEDSRVPIFKTMSGDLSTICIYINESEGFYGSCPFWVLTPAALKSSKTLPLAPAEPGSGTGILGGSGCCGSQTRRFPTLSPRPREQAMREVVMVFPSCSLNRTSRASQRCSALGRF